MGILNMWTDEERVADWRPKLNAFINERRYTPFEWGKHDCALWAADCVNVIIGYDFAKDIRGTYNTPEGAFDALKKVFNTDNLKQTFDKILGASIHVCQARPGDIVYRASNLFGFNIFVGICSGPSSFVVAEGDTGLVMLPTQSFDACYRIG